MAKKTKYELSNDWFDKLAKHNFELVIPKFINPKFILEVGCYEGASTTWLIEHIRSDAQIVCVDPWEPFGDFDAAHMKEVEGRFLENVHEAQKVGGALLTSRKEASRTALPALLADADYGASSFDFIYVDGSHDASDVLFDATLCWELLKPGGVIAFDDYGCWHGLSVKLAVDNFVQCHVAELQLIRCGTEQCWLRKNGNEVN